MARPPRDLLNRLTGHPGDYQPGYYRAADLVPVEVVDAEIVDEPPAGPVPAQITDPTPDGGPLYRIDDQTIVVRPAPGAPAPQIVGNGNTVVHAQRVRLTGTKTVSRAYGRGAVAAHEFGGTSNHWHGKTRQRGILSHLGGLLTWPFRHPKLAVLLTLAGALACIYLSLH
jgi:hypothetical protein